jgi:hypothetical protein
MSRPMRQLLRGKAEAKDHSDQPLDAALNQASYCEMEVAFADGSGYSVGIRARAATEALSPAWKRPSLERPNSHPDCVHSSAADRACMPAMPGKRAPLA